MTSIKIGLVYKLSIDNEINNIYIGSTFRNLKQRLAEHKYDIRNERRCKKKIEYFKDRTNDIKISIIEKCGDITKKELLEREKYYINSFKPTLNELCPIREVGECKKLYYIKNRERILLMRKQIVKCPNCSCDITINNLSRHLKTKKCKNFENDKKL